MLSFCPECGRFMQESGLTVCPDDGTPLKTMVSQAPEGDDPLLGTVVDGRFQILDRLGRGGMGAVYRAVQTSVERHVALKVIAGEVDPETARRFMLEARATSSLRDVHTVTVFDFGQTPEGMLYIAMELLEGISLEDHMLQVRSVVWPRALRTVAQIAESLAEAHGQGIVHRDLKPANIFLTKMGDDDRYVKVLDFGVARFGSHATVENLTGTGKVVGTPAYMAPEQARGLKVDARADVYALGLILYEMLSGHPPFRGESVVSVLMKHVNEPAPKLAEQDPPVRVPQRVEQLLDGLLCKDREQRIQSADEARRMALEILHRLDETDDYGEAGALLAGQPVLELVDVTGPTPAAVDSVGDMDAVGETGAATPPAKILLDTPEPQATGTGNAAFEPPASGRPPVWLVVLVVAGIAAAAGYALRGDPPAEPKKTAEVAESTATKAAPLTKPPETRPAVSAPAPPRQVRDAEPEPTRATRRGEARTAIPLPAPEPPVAATSIQLSTTPTGATVTGPDGGILGRTPFDLATPAADLTVRVKRRGHKTRRYTIKAGASGPLKLKLKKPSGGSDLMTY